MQHRREYEGVKSPDRIPLTGLEDRHTPNLSRRVPFGSLVLPLGSQRGRVTTYHRSDFFHVLSRNRIALSLINWFLPDTGTDRIPYALMYIRPEPSVPKVVLLGTPLVERVFGNQRKIFVDRWEQDSTLTDAHARPP